MKIIKDDVILIITNMLDELCDNESLALVIMLEELIKVKRKYPYPFNSYSEGYGVLKREMFEVDYAFAQEKEPHRIVDEVKQIGQLSIRIIGELGLKDSYVKQQLNYIKSKWRK